MDSTSGMEPAAKRALTEEDGKVMDTTLLLTTKHTPGALLEVLTYFKAANVNLLHLESRDSQDHPGDEANFLVVVKCERQVTDSILKNIAGVALHANVVKSEPDSPLDDPTVPWFPTKIAELDKFADRILSAGSELESDHPGFKDPVYRQRRAYFADIAIKYRHGEVIPRVEYTDVEVQTWTTIFTQLRNLYQTHACKEHNRAFPLLEKYCNFRPGTLPQLEDVSNFLQSKTGFRLRPVAGLLSSRDFLAGLAFRVFHSTQYIRHHTRPLYTPEPDICHELLGHAPLFADPSFAAFSQEIGLASLGAPDEWIQKLATLYWFTVEYGMCREDGELKAYGAGLLSSFGELKYCIKTKVDDEDDEVPVHQAFTPAKICVTEYPVTKYQPTYFVADSFADAKEKVKQFADTIPRRFALRYEPYTQTIEIMSRPSDLCRAVASARSNLTSLFSAIEKVC